MIRISGVTLAPVTDKRETPVGISYSKNIYCGADVYNLISIVSLLVTFYVQVDYLVVLSFSALGATKSSLSFSILSLGANESLCVSLSSKLSLDFYILLICDT